MPGGRVVVIAIHERPVELLVMSEAEIVGADGYEPAKFEAMIAAMADGIYDTTGWVLERPALTSLGY